jgi:hypothetical protein
MRVIDVSDQPGGQHNQAEHGDADHAPFRSDVIGPAAGPRDILDFNVEFPCRFPSARYK